MSYAKNSGVKMTLEGFIEAANKVHDNYYDYSKSDYVNSKTKLTIICPIHGEFSITPTKHLGRGQGCKYCKTNQKTSDEHRAQLKKFIEDKDYTLLSCPEKLNSGSRIKLKCSCGVGFIETRLSKFLKERTSSGCRLCNDKKPDKTWIKYFKSKWGDRYDYSIFTSQGANKPCEVICPKHGVFTTTPSKHKLRSGCPSCAKESSRYDNITIAERHKEEYLRKPCSVYLLGFENGLYKIGITQNQNERFNTITRNVGEHVKVDSIDTNRYYSIILESQLLDYLKPNIVGGRDFSEVFELEDEEFIEFCILFSKLKNLAHNHQSDLET